MHNASKRSQLGPPPRDAHQGALLGWSQNVLHEQVTMLKQIPDFLLDPLGLPRRFAGGGRRRTPAAKLGFHGGQLLADLGARVQNRFGQFLNDVKLAELVGNIAKNLENWPGYRDEPSVVMPRNSRPCLWIAAWNVRKNRSMSACVGSWSNTP